LAAFGKPPKEEGKSKKAKEEVKRRRQKARLSSSTVDESRALS
jgi:hypothetical protein